MDKKVEEFKLYLIRNRKSSKTIRNYIYDIIQFLDIIKKDIYELKNEDIELYKNYMLNNLKLELTSINRKLVAINQYLKYHQIPILVIQIKVHQQNFLNDVLTADEIDKMIFYARNRNDYRFIAIITTLRLTGMRISECLQLKITDIDSETVTILGKGNKRRNVFISDKVRQAWKDYLHYRIDKGGWKPLFTGQRGGITRSTVHKAMQEYGKMANIKVEKCHPHATRHYFCKTLSERGVALEDIADVAGHNSLETTRIYTRKTKKELLNIVNEL